MSIDYMFLNFFFSDKYLQVMESMQQQSSLANELRQIYHGLVGNLKKICDSYSHVCII